MATVLRARALWKSYAAGVTGCWARAWVLRGASLDVERGECVAVLGAAGAGTTTLIHCLAGLRRLDAGTIESDLAPQLVEPSHLDGDHPRGDRILLLDDDARSRRRPRLVREEIATGTTIIVATHELARVRTVADRVLLLHHGRLLPLHHLTRARRVAERADEAHR
ncbi:MAG TPA: ATP-binding cassette domain-containing protein [Gemmatimonadaceae bacterium]|nr:ATP-binding cassette domain-containing protein [Gemmatimonadaceae bacterium]